MYWVSVSISSPPSSSATLTLTEYRPGVSEAVAVHVFVATLRVADVKLSPVSHSIEHVQTSAPGSVKFQVTVTLLGPRATGSSGALIVPIVGGTFATETVAVPSPVEPSSSVTEYLIV